MITSALLNLAFLCFSFVVALLPAGGGLPTQFHTAMAYFGAQIGILSPIAPISEMGIALGLIIGLELIIFSVKIGKWVISHIPFVGGSK